MVLNYFKGVDQENINKILKTLTMDCVFSIETHGIGLIGHQEITMVEDKNMTGKLPNLRPANVYI